MDRLGAMAAFVRIVETGSFSAVAKEIGASQSTISKQMAALEKRLGAKLLNRTTRHISVTEAGMSYYEGCRRILSEIEEAHSNVGRFQASPVGNLKVAAPIAFGRLYMLPSILSFVKLYPEMRCNLVLNDRFIDPIKEGIDVAIRIGRLKDSSLIARKLGQSTRVIVATPEYFKQHGQPQAPADLTRHNCIVYSLLATGDQWKFPEAKGDTYIRVSGSIQVNTIEAVRDAALAGAGIAVLPKWLIGEHIRARRLKVVLNSFVPTHPEINAVYPGARNPPGKVRYFINFLQEQFGHDSQFR